MIKSAFRIKKSQFPSVLKGFSVMGTYFRAVISSSESKKPHISVVISKKHAKRAVMRNLIRRSVYHIIFDQLTIIPAKTIVFIMQKPVLAEKSSLGRQLITKEVQKDINSILEQIIKKYEKNS